MRMEGNVPEEKNMEMPSNVTSHELRSANGRSAECLHFGNDFDRSYLTTLMSRTRTFICCTLGVNVSDSHGKGPVEN